MFMLIYTESHDQKLKNNAVKLPFFVCCKMFVVNVQGQYAPQDLNHTVCTLWFPVQWAYSVAHLSSNC